MRAVVVYLLVGLFVCQSFGLEALAPTAGVGLNQALQAMRLQQSAALPEASAIQNRDTDPWKVIETIGEKCPLRGKDKLAVIEALQKLKTLWASETLDPNGSYEFQERDYFLLLQVLLLTEEHNALQKQLLELMAQRLQVDRFDLFLLSQNAYQIQEDSKYIEILVMTALKALTLDGADKNHSEKLKRMLTAIESIEQSLLSLDVVFEKKYFFAVAKQAIVEDLLRLGLQDYREQSDQLKRQVIGMKAVLSSEVYNRLKSVDLPDLSVGFLKALEKDILASGEEVVAYFPYHVVYSLLSSYTFMSGDCDQAREYMKKCLASEPFLDRTAAVFFNQYTLSSHFKQEDWLAHYANNQNWRSSDAMRGLALWSMKNLGFQSKVSDDLKERSLHFLMNMDVLSVFQTMSVDDVLKSLTQMYIYANKKNKDEEKKAIVLMALLYLSQEIPRGEHESKLQFWSKNYQTFFPGFVFDWNNAQWLDDLVTIQDDDAPHLKALKRWVSLRRIQQGLQAQDNHDEHSFDEWIQKILQLNPQDYQGEYVWSYREINKLHLDILATIHFLIMDQPHIRNAFEKQLCLWGFQAGWDRDNALLWAKQVNTHEAWRQYAYGVFFDLHRQLAQHPGNHDDLKAQIVRLRHELAHSAKSLSSPEQDFIELRLRDLQVQIAKETESTEALAEALALYVSQYHCVYGLYLSEESLLAGFEVSDALKVDVIDRMLRYCLNHCELARFYSENSSDEGLKEKWGMLINGQFDPGFEVSPLEGWRNNMNGAMAWLLCRHRKSEVEQDEFAIFAGMYARNPEVVAPIYLDFVYVHYYLKFGLDATNGFFKTKYRRVMQFWVDSLDQVDTTVLRDKFAHLWLYDLEQFQSEEDKIVHGKMLSWIKDRFLKGENIGDLIVV